MAKKNIILSNEDGKVAFSNTGSVYIENIDDSISTAELTASLVKLETLPVGEKILIANNNGINHIPDGNTDRAIAIWDGSNWTSSSLTYSEYSGSAGKDLFGSFPDPLVIDISNVNSGTLPVARGGTGLSVSETGSILKVSSAGVFSTLEYTGNSADNKILVNRDGSWSFSYPTHMPDIRYYSATGGVLSGNTKAYTWTKPSGKKYMRILAQGAGGGGSTGHSFPSSIHQGSGGGSGGFLDAIIPLTSIPNTVTVYVGIGGQGAIGNSATGENVWTGSTDSGGAAGTGGGGSGLYDGSNWIVICGPGGGAPLGWTGSGAGGTATISVGSGKTLAGSSGGYGGGGTGTANGSNATNNSTGGGTGGGASGGAINYIGIDATGRTFFYDNTYDNFGNLIKIGASAGATGAVWNSSNPTATAKPSKPLFGAGGGGGTAAWTGVASTSGQSGGGDGGDGYVLIVCW